MIADERSAISWLGSLAEYNPVAQHKLLLLVELLATENTRQNLIAASSLDQIWQRHIADSAQLLQHVPRGTPGIWLDLGSGAGFPGLVVAILRPEIDMVMVESRPKRAAWLACARARLELTSVTVIASRLEAMSTIRASVISARAFAPLERLLHLSARFSTSETLWLLPKGRSAVHELQALKGWRHMFHVKQSLTQADAGIIVGHLNALAEHDR